MTINTPTFSATGQAAQVPNNPKLKTACQQFEGQFFDMMLQEMRKTVPADGELGDEAHQQEIYQGMMDDKISQEMAVHGGSNDLANEMYRQLVMQEGAAAGATLDKASATAKRVAASEEPVQSTLKTDGESTENSTGGR